MDTQTIPQTIIFPILIGALAILVFYALLKVIEALTARATKPGEAAILDVLRSEVLTAILAAEKIALEGLKSGEVYVDSVDRKAIADKWYALLPDNITVAGRIIPIGVVKVLITQEAWRDLVQRVFDEADARIKAAEAFLTKDLPPGVVPPPLPPGNAEG